MIPEDATELEELQATPEHVYDMAQAEPVVHQFDRIVGNELRCSLHSTCAVMIISPTQVLEKGADGQLQLVDMAPDLK